MFGLDQSPRYACRSTSPPPPAPLPRSGFVHRPQFRRFKLQANWAIRLDTFTDRTPSWTHAKPILAPWNREVQCVAMQTPECATKLRFVLPPRFPGATDRAGKQNSPTCDPLKRFNFLKKNGAGEAIRTPDPNLGKVVLYP